MNLVNEKSVRNVRVKIFESRAFEYLEEEINEFLASSAYFAIDIKYSSYTFAVNGMNFTQYTAMVIYDGCAYFRNLKKRGDDNA